MGHDELQVGEEGGQSRMEGRHEEESLGGAPSSLE